MSHRHAISDADRGRVKHLLPGQPGQHGGVAKGNRRLTDAALYVARAGTPWEDLPARFGNRSRPWRRFDRWAAKGRRDPTLAALRDPDLDVLILDSTAARARPCAAGARKVGTGPAARAIRRLVAAGAGSAPRPPGASTGWGTRPRCS